MLNLKHNPIAYGIITLNRMHNPTAHDRYA